LKEELTTYDAAGAPTVTAKEFLGVDHTRVTVSDAETTTVVTTEATGVVTKAVKDMAADGTVAKTVTTKVDATNAVTVTEQVGTAAAVTTATGTLSVEAGTGVETLALTTLNANGDVTGSEVRTVEADGTETKAAYDTNNVLLSETEEWEYNDGTVWTLVEEGGVSTETYTKTNGEIETVTTQANGDFEITQQLLNTSGILQASTPYGNGTATTVNGLYVETIDLGSGNTETRSWDVNTQTEVTTFKTGGVTTSVQTEQTLENGNNTVEVDVYSGGDATNLGTLQTSTDKVISVDGTVQEKVTNATGEITLKEIGVDGAGKAFEKVLGTGTSEVVGGVVVNTITLADKSTVTERFDSSGELAEKIVADQGGDKKISTFDSNGTEAIAYADAGGQAIQASEVDIKLDIGFANDDLGFVNVDYTDMASGFTSQADNFNLAVDYSNSELATSDGGYASGTYVNTNNGGNNTGGNNTGGNNTGGNNTGGNNTGGNSTGGNDTVGDNAGANNTGANNNVNVADYTDYSSFYGDGSTTGGYDYSYDIY
jgi:hypothetical protein